MKYPNFIKKNSNIGVCALSAGVGNRLEDYLTSVNVLINSGYNVVETSSVRNNSDRSNDALSRARELDQLITNKNIDMVMCACGGDYQLETVPLINYEHIKKNPKWIMGASDPTNLLFTVTTKLDIATLYGLNACSYSSKEKLEIENNLSMLKGKLVKQVASKSHIDFIDSINDINKRKKTKWKPSQAINTSGRCIGGCLDVIAKLIGTKYDYTNMFLKKYKNDGFIWYFDNFALDTYNTYLTLLQFKNAGWFDNCKCVLFGRVAFPSNQNCQIKTYEEAYKLALGDIPYISEMDISHSKPKMTMINGAIVKVSTKDNSIKFELR